MDKYLRAQAGMSRSTRRDPASETDPLPVALGAARASGVGITDVLGARKAAG
jgi:hypothetical protein